MIRNLGETVLFLLLLLYCGYCVQGRDVIGLRLAAGGGERPLLRSHN